jgi:3-dehydroquinate synthetase
MEFFKEEVIQPGDRNPIISSKNGKSWLVSSFELDSSIRNEFEFGHSLALQLEMLVN